jgi:hypothetical protein
LEIFILKYGAIEYIDDFLFSMVAFEMVILTVIPIPKSYFSYFPLFPS